MQAAWSFEKSNDCYQAAQHRRRKVSFFNKFVFQEDETSKNKNEKENG